MRVRVIIPILAGLVLLNIGVQHCLVRWDMTDDKRYSLSAPTRQLLEGLDEPMEITLLLQGDLNAGFRRLQQATEEFTEEMRVYARTPVRVHYADGGQQKDLSPTVIHERTRKGKTEQTTVYPYAVLHYGGKEGVVNLLCNQRGLSGEENLNQSIENLEFAFVECLRGMTQSRVDKVAFLEGHGELPEAHVYDLTQALAHYYQVDRGVLGNETGVLDDYKTVIIADPQQPFSDEDKYILDQYIMQGGSVLWVLNGVRFSADNLSAQGKTPIVPLDLNLTDMLFRYGVRVNAVLVQDLQCLPVPVDVSDDPNHPNWQPMPWTYAPLLLTSQESPVTRNVMQVSAMMASGIDRVGADDGIRKEVLLATSSNSRVTAAPAEVNLSFDTGDESDYQYAHIPVAMALEGVFPSLYAHQLPPEDMVLHSPLRKQSVPAKQMVVAAGSTIRNEVQQNQVVPLGYDRYTRTQFGNREFFVNAVLYLSDDIGWMALRKKEVTLRLLNDQRAINQRPIAQCVSIAVPLVLLAGIGGSVRIARKKQYVR